jgi:hypothetical protein
VVATTVCRARLSDMLPSCNGGSMSRPIIGDEDGQFGLQSRIENIVTAEITYCNHGQKHIVIID